MEYRGVFPIGLGAMLAVPIASNFPSISILWNSAEIWKSHSSMIQVEANVFSERKERECSEGIIYCPPHHECTEGIFECPSQCDPNLYQCPTRSEIEEIPDIPYIITPRRTYLLNDRPSFRWNRVEGATSYTVSLMEIDEAAGTFQKLWSQSSTETAIDYPADAPSLKPEVEYLLMVETDTGASSQTERIPGGVGFRLLEADRIQEILADLVQIEEENLDPTAKALAIASLYVENGAIAAAVRHLEETAESRMTTAPIYAGLGKLYGEYLALPRQGSEFDCQAIDLADETQSQVRDAALERLERFGRTCEME